MEKDIELLLQSWNLATEGREGLLQGLLPHPVRSKIEAFRLPKPVDDDGTDVSLKDWQLGLRSSEPTAIRPFKSSKRITRARTFKPVQPWLDEFVVSSPDKFHSAPTTPRGLRSSASGKHSGSDSPPRPEVCQRGDLSLPEVSHSNKDGSNVDEITGGESPFITLDTAKLNDAEPDDFNNRASAGSLRVSSEDEAKVSRSLTPPRVAHRSLSMAKSTRVRPTLVGVSSREGKESALPLPGIESAYESHGISGSRDRVSQLRHCRRHARTSLDSIGEGSKYDSAFDFPSSSSASSYQSHGLNTSVSDPNSPSALLRCNGRREHDDEDEDENVKVGIFCGRVPETSISADVVRLVSKLCRLTVPLPEQSASKPSLQIGHKRSNSVPALTSWDSMLINSSWPTQDVPILGRQTSLKLLCERCSSGPTPAYDLPKPRKIRDLEAYQHFYKPISKTLDQKLRFGRTYPDDLICSVRSEVRSDTR